jgi:hypothetical protein
MRAWFRRVLLRRSLGRLRKGIEAGALDFFLETLLRIMGLVFLLDKDYGKNIDGFVARYSFRSRDGRIAASAVFDGDRMKVKRGALEETNVTVTFRDGKALKEYLFSDNPDIIGSILDNSVTYDGNLNYLAKFAYMARNLQLRYAL